MSDEVEEIEEVEAEVEELTAEQQLEQMKVEAEVEELTAEEQLEQMNELHIELARKAAKLALDVLEGMNPKEIPAATAVSLLKFGVELERKALGQTEDEDGSTDPFDELAKAMAGGEGEQDGPDR